MKRRSTESCLFLGPLSSFSGGCLTLQLQEINSLGNSKINSLQWFWGAQDSSISALASDRSGTIMMRELEIAINFNHVGIWDPSLIPCSLGFKLSSGIFFSYALQLVRQNRALRAFSQCFEFPKRSQSLFEIVLATCIMPMQFHMSVLNSGFLKGTKKIYEILHLI